VKRRLPHGRHAASALAALCALALHAVPAQARTPELARADSLRLTGHYLEARAAYSALAAREPALAARGLARCMAAVGEGDPAIATLAAAAAKQKDAALEAEWAELEFERGGRRVRS
jgi:thioredoxin-like negative regulator of GroEL